MQCVVVRGFATSQRLPRLAVAMHVQQNAPNQCLPQPEFGAQADGVKGPQPSRILEYSHLCLCMRMSLRFHLASKILDYCCSSNCFTPESELTCSASNLCIDASRTWPRGSNSQTQAPATPFQRTWRVGLFAKKQEADQIVHKANVGQIQCCCCFCT